MSKIRTDFVTNSSSSSFILGFNKVEDISDVRTGHDFVIKDIKDGITDIESIVKLYKECIWTTEVRYNGKTYWNLSNDEINSEGYKKFIEDYENKECDKLREKLSKYNVLSLVEYGDNINGELEHDIMPYLDCCVQRISHH